MELFDLYDDEEEDDPIMLSFIRNLKAHGNSHVLDIIDEYTGLPMFVKYEEDDENDEMTEVKGPDPSTDKSRESEESGRDVSSVVETNKGAVVKSTVDESCNHPLDMAPLSCISQDQHYSTFLKAPPRIHLLPTVFVPIPTISSTGFGRVTVSPLASDMFRRRGTLSSGILGVLNNRKIQEKSGSQRKALENGACRELVVTTEPVSFSYTQQLIEVLRKPYDHKEYQALLKEATHRKPVTKFRHLRGESKSYITEEKGMSYVDHHPDLARQLKVSDRRKRLTLLRGLFFYLKYAGHTGAFPPWRALPSC